jgi:hypothetical protein
MHTLPWAPQLKHHASRKEEPWHAMQFRPPPPPQVRDEYPANSLRGVTVTDRYVPMMTAAYGTRVARPA